MTTVSDLVARAIGTGVANATVFLPITYFATRMQFRLRSGLAQAWRPYVSSVLLLGLLELFGYESSTKTPIGLVSLFLVPVIVCVIALYVTYRQLPDVPGE